MQGVHVVHAWYTMEYYTDNVDTLVAGCTTTSRP